MPNSEEVKQQTKDDEELPEEGNDQAYTENETGTKDGRVPSDE